MNGRDFRDNLFEALKTIYVLSENQTLFKIRQNHTHKWK